MASGRARSWDRARSRVETVVRPAAPGAHRSADIGPPQRALARFRREHRDGRQAPGWKPEHAGWLSGDVLFVETDGGFVLPALETGERVTVSVPPSRVPRPAAPEKLTLGRRPTSLPRLCAAIRGRCAFRFTISLAGAHHA